MVSSSDPYRANKQPLPQSDRAERMSLASKNSSGSLGSRESNQQRHPKAAQRFDSTPKLPNTNQVINLKLKNGKGGKIMSVQQFEKIAISQNDYPMSRGKP